MTGRPIAVIPAAGVGTRLRPHTLTQPKVLLQVAGKPILAHILDDLPGLGIEEAVLIIGYLGDRVRAFIDRHYPHLRVHYAEQAVAHGLGHAVGMAAPFVGDRPLLVILGDSVFDVDLRGLLASKTHCIGVKAVDDPRRFGVVEVDATGRVTRMVEKPEHPASNLAITGLYFFARGGPLFTALADNERLGVRTRGEIQLTDAMQRMVETGEVFTTYPVANWFDCGKIETLLETNRALLDKLGAAPAIRGSVVVPPVVVADGAVVEHCYLGPHVSVAAGARLHRCGLRDAIVNENAVVEDILIEGSVVGEGAVIRGAWTRLNVGETSDIEVR